MQDGRSSGLTAPNGPSQQDVIVAAMEAASVLSDDLKALEMHGTGTALGDPIEIGAICAVFKVSIAELTVCLKTGIQLYAIWVAANVRVCSPKGITILALPWNSSSKNLSRLAYADWLLSASRFKSLFLCA